jgi:nicotinate-nucleotide adenylyltransferase
MTLTQGSLGILGGAFDPVHFGHLRCALEVYHQIGLDQVLLVPSANPPHRAAHVASSEQRLAMLEAAVVDVPQCAVDSRELYRAGPSWSVLTLAELRAENPQTSLCMIVGADAFLGLAQWHRWEELLGLAHIVIACRPGSQLPADGLLAELLAERQISDASVLHQSLCGRIKVCEITQLDISSTVIREQLAAGENPRYLLPDAVLRIITDSACYPSNDLQD